MHTYMQCAAHACTATIALITSHTAAMGQRNKALLLSLSCLHCCICCCAESLAGIDCSAAADARPAVAV
jgi:hypothetical protein